jgi:hypothetical protein
VPSSRVCRVRRNNLSRVTAGGALPPIHDHHISAGQSHATPPAPITESHQILRELGTRETPAAMGHRAKMLHGTERGGGSPAPWPGYPPTPGATTDPGRRAMAHRPSVASSASAAVRSTGQSRRSDHRRMTTACAHTRSARTPRVTGLRPGACPPSTRTAGDPRPVRRSRAACSPRGTRAWSTPAMPRVGGTPVTERGYLHPAQSHERFLSP